MPRPVIPPVRRTFRALAAAILPEMEELTGGGWRRHEEIVEDALARRSSAVRRQLKLFIRLLNLLPIPFYLRTFRGLSPRRRILFLRKVQDAPILKVRQGFWGLRTLVFMGFYGQDQVHEEIGYRVHVRGFQARGRLDPATGAVSEESP